MLKIVFCLKRRPEISREEFQRYWREEHVIVLREVAAPLGLRRNVHNDTITTPLDGPIRERRGIENGDYDGVAESWFDSVEAMMAAMSTDEGRQAARRLAEDEARFVDFSRSRVFFVNERTVIG